MAQITLTSGATVHTLPYPSDYNEVEAPKVANYLSYGGYRLQDKTLNDAGLVRNVQMQWQNADATDMATLTSAYADLQLGDLWDYAGPDGDAGSARINPDLSKLNITRYAGPGGDVLYTVRWNLIVEII